MTYAKPELVRLSDALSAIQNTMSKTAGPGDSLGSTDHVTIPAYDADE